MSNKYPVTTNNFASDIINTLTEQLINLILSRINT